MTDHVVELDAVTKAFGSRTVIHELSLGVPPGAIVGVIGPSGSGKTTAVRLMTGVYRPDAGHCLLFGRDAAGLSRRDRSRIGYLPQTPVLSPELTLRTNLRFLSAINGARRRQRKRRTGEVLRLVRLDGQDLTKAREASGGMQRRAAIAGALLHEPDLLFLDEPTAGIDPILRAELWDRFRQLRDEGKTLIVTTQYVSEAAYCDQVALITGGRLVAHGPPEELRRRGTGGELIEIVTSEPMPAALVPELAACAEVDDVEVRDRTCVRVLTQTPMEAHAAIRGVLDALAVVPDRVEDVDLSYDEVFVRLVEQATQASPRGEEVPA